jgi:hypothetical protein
VNFGGANARSGYFDVAEEGSIDRAPTLLPVTLSSSWVVTGASMTMTLALDRPAPPWGAVIIVSSDNASLTFPLITVAAGATNASYSFTASSQLPPSTPINITASYNGVRKAAFHVRPNSGGPPAAPVGLAAVAGDQSVTLSWTATSGASSYNVKRARAANGSFQTIYAGLKSPGFIDNTVINDVSYYYKVSAVNDFGEGQNSAVQSATPTRGPVGAPTIMPVLADVVAGSTSVLVTLTGSVGGSFIYYTLDGSAPNQGSILYKGPFPLNASAPVRARAYKSGYQPSTVVETDYTLAKRTIANGIACGYPAMGTLNASIQDYSWFRGINYYAQHYSFTASGGETVTFESSADTFDSVIYIANASYTQLAMNDDAFPGTRNSKLTYQVPSGVPAHSTFYVEVTTATPGQVGDYTLYMDCGTTPPAIAIVQDAGETTPISRPPDPPATVTLASPNGNVYVGGAASYALYIRNESSEAGLNVSRIQVTGDFVLRSQSVPVIRPNNEATINIGMSTATPGLKTGTLTVTSDDTAHSPYVVNLNATVLAVSAPSGVQIDLPSNNDTLPDTHFPDINNITVEVLANTVSGISAAS